MFDLEVDTKLTDIDSYMRVFVHRYSSFPFASMGVDHGGEWYSYVPIVSSIPPRLQRWLLTFSVLKTFFILLMS